MQTPGPQRKGRLGAKLCQRECSALTFLSGPVRFNFSRAGKHSPAIGQRCDDRNHTHFSAQHCVNSDCLEEHGCPVGFHKLRRSVSALRILDVEKLLNDVWTVSRRLLKNHILTSPSAQPHHARTLTQWPGEVEKSWGLRSSTGTASWQLGRHRKEACFQSLDWLHSYLSMTVGMLSVATVCWALAASQQVYSPERNGRRTRTHWGQCIEQTACSQSDSICMCTGHQWKAAFLSFLADMDLAGKPRHILGFQRNT